MKGELGEQITKEFFGRNAKTHSYLKDNSDEDEKRKTQKSVSQR